MKYLETKHERNSAKITSLIVLILCLLLFVVGMPYMDPPLEYGVAVNFGNSDVGMGTIQPTEPIKSERREVIEEPEVEATKIEQTTSEASNSKKAENVLTADNDEAIAIKKQRELADAKAKAERAQKEKEAAIAKKRQEETDKKATLDALIGGVKSSDGNNTAGEGPDGTSGDKGQLDGDPYAPYKGMPGSGSGGIGYGLNGRGKPSYKMLEGCQNEYGLIVVDIVVNQAGNVIGASPGTKGSNNITSCLKEVAKKMALTYKWPPDQNAPARQYGRISINFTPTN